MAVHTLCISFKVKHTTMNLSYILATLLVVAVGASASLNVKAPVDAPLLIFSADDGTYSGMSELHYISNVTRVVHNFSSSTPACQSALVGVLTIPTQYRPTGGTVNVVLITTGIGETASTLCTTQVLNYLASTAATDSAFKHTAPQTHQVLAKRVKSLANLHEAFPMALYTGTSGFSPSVGGLEPTQASGCTTNVRAPITPISIGSVCVSPTAFSPRCGFWVEDIGSDAAGGECTSTPTPNYNNQNIFGRCHQSSVEGGKALQEMVIAAQGASGQWIDDIKAPAGTRSMMKAFWQSHQVGPVAAPHTGSNPWEQSPYIFTQCAEASDHAIAVGSLFDIVCRRRVGELMGPFGVPGKEAAPICVAAMEGFGFFQAMTQSTIPSLNIRGASNYGMYPLYAAENSEFWKQNVSFVPSATYEQASIDGYHYAIQTTNHVILKTIAFWKNTH